MIGSERYVSAWGFYVRECVERQKRDERQKLNWFDEDGTLH
jgi:hypothetical protein